MPRGPGRRLPSEAAWELAARAGDQRWRFPWGNQRRSEHAERLDGGERIRPPRPDTGGLVSGDRAGHLRSRRAMSGSGVTIATRRDLKQLPDDGSALRVGYRAIGARRVMEAQHRSREGLHQELVRRRLSRGRRGFPLCPAAVRRRLDASCWPPRTAPSRSGPARPRPGRRCPVDRGPPLSRPAGPHLAAAGRTGGRTHCRWRSRSCSGIRRTLWPWTSRRYRGNPRPDAA